MGKHQKPQNAFPVPDPEYMNDTVEKPEEWTLVTSLSYLLKLSEDSELKKPFWAEAREALDYAAGIMGLSDVQILAVALLANDGNAMSWHDMGEYLGCTRLEMMAWNEELEDLVEKGWAVHYSKHNFGSRWMGFRLEKGVVTAIQKNKCFEPEKTDGLTLQDFVDKLSWHINMNMHNDNIIFEDDIEWMLRLVNKNPELEICKIVNTLGNRYDKALLLLVISDYAMWADTPSEGLQFETIANLFPDEHKCGNIRRELRHGTHNLLNLKYIEYGNDSGIADSERFMLGDDIKEKLLSEYKPTHSNCAAPKTKDSMLFSHTLVKSKEMYYNAAEQKLVDRLKTLLQQENFKEVQSRMEEKGMRKGFACIFYGDPGTGKTETVLQIARLTHRDIMRVEVAGMRDKWVGQSEKNIKSVFRRYRQLCRNLDTKPILFFNEADAIFGRRFDTPDGSVEKMDNAIQNIILQEMEDLDGILIATTNLTSSLDPAFERRFLFKVEFHKPDLGAKCKIWQSMIGDSISSEDTCRLARKYDLTGAQIENIVRKQTIDYVLCGQDPSIEQLKEYCEEELNGMYGTHKSVGFRS